MRAIKCSSLQVTHGTSVHRVLVRTAKLDASNHKGSGGKIISCSRNKENQKRLANSTNGDHKEHGVRKPAPGCQCSRKKFTLCSKQALIFCYSVSSQERPCDDPNGRVERGSGGQRVFRGRDFVTLR